MIFRDMVFLGDPPHLSIVKEMVLDKETAGKLEISSLFDIDGYFSLLRILSEFSPKSACAIVQEFGSHIHKSRDMGDESTIIIIQEK